ncbi:unnamed protein product [Macrosiphum euphorbiae]|uniref:SAP domain-containing protein n=1 Tax=Macrosiphum euphorbiae TaxID=13131 RepID=A0AAV0XBH0_9HEMI|nr:unnamed protein product [Macrosiphum euphorbiae]
MQSGQKTLSELTIGELKGELTKRGLGTMGTKSELYLTLEQYIQETEGENPQNYVFYKAQQNPPQPPTAWVTETHPPGGSKKEDQQIDTEQQKTQDNRKTQNKNGENPTSTTNLLERTLAEILDRLVKLEATSTNEPILGAMESLTERIKKLEKPGNGKNPENFQESQNNETQRNPPGQHQNRGDETTTTQYDTINQKKNGYDTYSEPQGFTGFNNREKPNEYSTLFPTQGTSTMVTTSITNVITSTTCANTNSREPNHPIPGHWENQNHRVGFSNTENTITNGPYTVTYGENHTQRDNTHQTMIRDWPEESNLLPRKNLQAAKDALPEYSGKKEEDPTRFLNTSRDVLLEAKIPRQRWVKVLASQLKGDAGTWWGRIRAIDPTWEEFHREFTNKFNGPQVRAKLHTELMGWKQYYGQPTGDFVLQKIQLFRRLNTGLDEENAVETIIQLMRPEHQNLIRVQKPKTFMELNEATYTVTDQTQTKGKSHWDKTETTKPELSTPQQNRQREFWNTTKSGNGKMVGENPPTKK